MLKNFFTFIFVSFLITGCTPEPFDDGSSFGVDPLFEPTTSEFNVITENIEDLCVYENNYVLAYADTFGLVEHSWSLVLEDGSSVHLSYNNGQVLTRSGEYIYKRRGLYQGVSQDTTLRFFLEYCQAYVDFPDVFEPNGDGEFDFWSPIGAGVKSIDFVVFDQKNKLIFEGKSMSEKWDGTINGEKAPIGTYSFEAKGSLESGYLFEYAGLFELIR